jgi:hypothetical protein
MGWKTLKSSVFVSQFEGGVVFRGGETPVVFRGKRAHDLVRALVSLMERKMTQAAMVAQFPESAQPVARQLLDELEGKHLLRERDEEDPAPETELDFHLRNLWNYLADHLARPGEAFIRWQETRFYLAGPVEASLYAVRALAECAARRIVLLAPDLSPGQSGMLDEIRAEFESLSVEVRSGVAHEASPAANGTSDSIWIYSAGDSEFSSSDSTLSDAWYFGLLSGHLVIAFVDGSLADLVPQWRTRVRPALAGGQTGRLSEQRVALAAAATAFAALNRQTGIEKAAIPYTLRVVELTSQITPITLPDAPTIHSRAEPFHAEQNGFSAPDGDAQIAATHILFDPIGGILKDELEIDLVQVPLSVIPLRVFAHDRNVEPRCVFGWGNTVAEARCRAIQRAIKSHLLTIPAISEHALAVAVEWSADLSDSNALAAATMNELRDAGVEGDPLQIETLAQPGVCKLFKLLSLMTATQPALTVWRSADPPSARVQVILDGKSIGDASAPSVNSAAYEALGDACMAVQLPELSLTPQIRQAAPNAPAMNETFELHSKQVDLGYPTLRDDLHCAVVRRGVHPC